MTLELFHYFKKNGFLNDWSRNILIATFSTLSIAEARAVREILCYLIRYDNINHETFTLVMFNPYKRWDGSQGHAIHYLKTHALLTEYKDYILRDAKHSGEIAVKIGFLSKLPTWPSIKLMLERNPDNAHIILETFYRDYETEAKLSIKKRNSSMTDYQIFAEVFHKMREVSNSQPSSDSLPEFKAESSGQHIHSRINLSARDRFFTIPLQNGPDDKPHGCCQRFNKMCVII